MPHSTATVTVHPEFSHGDIDPRVFGSFVEHMGRCVYTGIYEPDHPTADAAGFRGDVAELIAELGVTTVRYPGGNFVSGYDWRDGIGPVAQRPTRLDLAWRSVEPNLVGLDEFLPWAARCGLDPMMAVNLGTAGIRCAAQLVEYCNLGADTSLVAERITNGHPDPYRIATWCLGNEMDGPWQIGHATAAEYGRRAAEAGRAMRMVDPDIELVACGSSFRHMPTFGAWEATVAELTMDVADFMSMHSYYDGRAHRQDFLASGHRLDRFITDVVNTCDAVAARLNSGRRMQIALDEWNVWSSAAAESPVGQPRDIALTPRITEDAYQVLDAVVLGDLIVSILNHADRVRIACLSLLVNVSAPIMTEPGGPAYRQSIFHPFAAAARLARGDALHSVVRSEEYRTPSYGTLPSVAVATTFDRSSGSAAMFLTNRADTPVFCTVNHGGFDTFEITNASTLNGADGRDPSQLGLTPLTDVQTGARASSIRLPAESWTAVEIAATA